MIWTEGDFSGPVGYGADYVRGHRYGAFGVYVRAYRDTMTGEQRTVAYLVHLPSRFAIGAFIRQELAQRAGEIADTLIDCDFQHLTPQAQAREVRAIFDAWKKSGISPSYLMDDANSMQWCEARDADGKTGLEFDLLTIRGGDQWLP